MSRGKHGRHLPAFILLFLAQEPAYGAVLLSKFQELLCNVNIDSAAIYRGLQDLEKENAVEFYWDTTEPGPAKKWYKITDKGLFLLEEFKVDIEMRKRNFEFFLQKFTELKEKGDCKI